MALSHIAQLNVGTAAYNLDDPRMADFVNNLDRVNAIAERSKGFVWRLKDEATGDATSIRAGDDPRLIVNMSVWETVEDLERFVFATVHRKFMSAAGNGSGPCASRISSCGLCRSVIGRRRSKPSPGWSALRGKARPTQLSAGSIWRTLSYG